MQLTRISDQASESLLDFYAPSETDDDVRRAEQEAMHSLLLRLESDDGPDLWALTSVNRLKLVGGDDYRLPVIVLCYAELLGRSRKNGYEYGYHISYPLPSKLAPWNDAWVYGIASDIDSAVNMILASIRYSAFGPCAEPPDE